jgi:hypothetical protein
MILPLTLFVFLIAFSTAAYFVAAPAVFAYLLTLPKLGVNQNHEVDKNTLYFIVFLTFVFFMSSILNGIGVEAIKVFLRYCFYGLIAYVFTSRMHVLVKNLDSIFVLMTVLPLLLIWLPQLYHYEYVTGDTRYQFIFSHPNHFAYYLCSVLLYFATSARTGHMSVRDYVFSALVIFMLLINKSSGGVLTALVILAISNYRRILDVRVVPFIFIGAILFLYFFNFDKVNNQIAFLADGDIRELVEDGNLGGSGSLAWRLVYWYLIVSEFFYGSLSDILFGVGFGTMSLGNYPYFFMYTDPHNDFIRIFVENGIIGISFFLFVIYKLASSLPKNKLCFLAAFLLPMLYGNVVVNHAFMIVMLLVYARIRYTD